MIVSIRENKDDTRVLVYSDYTIFTGWGSSQCIMKVMMVAAVQQAYKNMAHYDSSSTASLP